MALSADGRVALIGALSYNGGPQGAAFVYDNADGAWSTAPAATLTGPLGGGFGTSVALSADGTVAMVGEPNPDGTGAVYIYDKSLRFPFPIPTPFPSLRS